MAREPTNGLAHLRPHAPVAERVLAPGDPGRALRPAQVLIDGPKMLNHNRGPLLRAVLAAAARRGVAAAAILLVTGDAGGGRLDDAEALHAAELVLGRAGAAALGAV